MGGIGSRYDQRVAVYVELTGDAEDRQRAEKAFEEMGWPVLRKDHGTEYTITAKLGYVLEVRLMGSRWRSGHGAHWHIKRLADRAQITLIPRVSELLDRRSLQVPTWAVRTESTDVTGTGIRACLKLLWRRLTEWFGVHDTGRVVTAGQSDALEWATDHELPGIPAPRSNVAIRPPLLRSSRAHGRMPSLPRETARGWSMWAVGTMVVSAYCGPWAAYAGVRRSLLFPVVTFASLCLLAGYLLWKFSAGQQPKTAAAAAVGACSLLAALAYSGSLFTTPGMIVEALTAPSAVALLGRGIYLLFRQWTHRQVLLASAVALLPVVLPWATGAGTLLDLFYSAPFRIPPADIEISEAWRTLAAMRVLAVFSLLTLLPLAGWGYAKHYHLWLVDRLVTSALPFLIVPVVGLAFMLLVFDPPGEAAQEAMDSAVAGYPPVSYFGIHAELTCVEPVKALSEIPVIGGHLEPSRPYLSFGVVDGSVTLWDPKTKSPIKVPSDAVSLIPVGDHRSPARLCPNRN